jgi:hypothetical protein
MVSNPHVFDLFAEEIAGGCISNYRYFSFVWVFAEQATYFIATGSNAFNVESTLVT